MADTQHPMPQSDEPWLRDQMPCVYCGQSLGRDSTRCPHCKTSYSVAVRRASREIEGPWFYLEPRNPSNRGVDLNTAADFIRAGSAALGVGSSLVNNQLLADGDLDELTRRAEAFIAEVQKGRA